MRTIFGKCLLMGVSFFIFFFFMLMSKTTYAQLINFTATKMKVIDKTRITYDGKTYTDSNPYDGKNEWVSQESCGDIIHVKDYDTRNMSFDVEVKESTSTSSCETKRWERDIQAEDGDRITIYGYKISDNRILFPVGFKDAGCALDGRSESVDRGTIHTFKRADKNDSNYQASRFFLEQNGNPPLNDKIDLQLKDFNATVFVDSYCKARVPQTITERFRVRIPGKSAITAEVKQAYKIRDDGSIEGGGNQADGGEGDDDAGDAQGDQNACDVQMNNPLSWVLCPVMRILEGAVNTFASSVENVLNYRIDQKDNNVNQFQAVWVKMRNIANALFIIAFLFVIISQAIIGRF